MSLAPINPSSEILSQLFTSSASYAGRKVENQDTLIVQTLLPMSDDTVPKMQDEKNAWLVAAVADGVSSCAKPKLASEWVIDTLIDQLKKRQVDESDSNLFDFNFYSNGSIESIAQSITKSVQIINDFLYFSDDGSIEKNSQRYLPKLLSTLTGILFTEHILTRQVAVLFHTGDSRIYRLRHKKLSLLTQDHRQKYGRDKGALSAALGANANIELQVAEVDVLPEDVFLIMTDGVYEFINDDEIILFGQSALEKLLESENTSVNDLEILPEVLCKVALENGSYDNVSCLMIAVMPRVITTLASNNFGQSSTNESVTHLQIPSVLNSGDRLDNFTIDKVIQNTPRSTIYLATDNTADKKDNQRIIKVPSAYYEDDRLHLRLFLKEEKIGLSFNHPSLLKFYPKSINSQFLYHVTEYVQGMSLREYIDTQPPLSMKQTFDIVNQVGLALRVIHRNYMLHQDIKPENIMLLPSGTIKLIDFGSVGSILLKTAHTPPVGDLHYIAPEYFSDAPKGVYSDIFSLGVLTYELLTGKRPFNVEAIATASTTQKLTFKNMRQLRPELPFWINDVMIRAMLADSSQRYQAIGDFLIDLDPNSHVIVQDNEPILTKNPVLFWQGVSAILAIVLILVLVLR